MHLAATNLQGLKARQTIAQGKRDEVRAALGESSNNSPKPIKGGTNPPQYLRQVPLGEFMLPNAEDTPTALSECASDFVVAPRIAREFGRPKSHPRFRRPPVTRTAMPETTVHKHRQSGHAENEIWLARQRRPTPPTGDADSSHQCAAL
jgi:hypothetical protein